MIKLQKSPYFTYGDKIRMWKRLPGEEFVVSNNKENSPINMLETINAITRNKVTMEKIYKYINNVLSQKEKCTIIAMCGNFVDEEFFIEQNPNSYTDFIMIMNNDVGIKISWKPQLY